MIVGSVSENKNLEKRISITPDIAKKYINLGFEVQLSENYGKHLGFKEKEYNELGVKFISDDKKLIENADIIIQMSLLDEDKTSLLKSNQTFIGVLNPYENKNKLDELVKKKVNLFSLELLPRITRAQSMDILSSQANLAGYKAVVESFSTFEKAIPMMMTAAGTIPAAKVLVVGAGVAGLQAIATAKRMGAIVFATDVRMASKEQVESLGGKFLTVEGAENLETEAGYAKEASEEFKKKQEELLSETLKKIDIVICTALIPGKKAPLIIKKYMLENMQPGSVIYDLAAVQGGNVAFSEIDKIIEKNDVLRIEVLGDHNNYRSNVTRTAVVGKPTQEQKDIWAVLIEAKSKCESILRPGIQVPDLYQTYVNACRSGGIEPTLKFLGHGIGLTIHEEPYITDTRKYPLGPNMTHTMEPLFMIPGKMGFHVEDMYRITDSGFSRITGELLPNHDLIEIEF